MQDGFSFSCMACDTFTLHHTNLDLREKMFISLWVVFSCSSLLQLVTLWHHFLQKSVSVLASGEALQDHVCSMEERC